MTTQDAVQQVPAQSVYTLELAVGEEVAHKEYMDYTRAKQAYDDAVADTLALTLVGVTRVELFSEAVGSLDKWVRDEPALAGPVPPAGGEPEVLLEVEYLGDGGGGWNEVTPEWFEKAKQSEYYRTRVIYSPEHVTRLQAEVGRLDRESQNLSNQLGACDRERRAFRDELTKARELLTGSLRTGDGYDALIEEYLSNQSAPADKVCEHNRQVYNVMEDHHTCVDCNARGPFPAKGMKP
jgi:hypothetical protein